MKKTFVVMLCAAALIFGGFAVTGTYQYAAAQGPPDAGMTVSSGAKPDAPALRDEGPDDKVPPDVVDDPGSYAQDVLAAYRAAQYAFFVVLILFAISQGALWVGDRYTLPWLAKARPYLVFGSSVLGGAIVSISALEHVDLRVVMGAIAAAFMLELRTGRRTKETVEARAQRLYEAYATHTGWKSAVTGAKLPAWPDLPVAVHDAWLATAKAA